MAGHDRPQDSYRYGPDEIADLAERTGMAPVAPAAIRERFDDGQRLVTTDIPRYLGRPIASDVDTSIALYRLVQLFGTPNVPGLEAGAPQPLRERTTWQYCFEFTVEPAESEKGGSEESGNETDGSETHLVSVYDYETNLSVGVSAWQVGEPDARRPGPEPTADALPTGEMPDEARLELVVKLVLSTVEHAVEATHEGLHI